MAERRCQICRYDYALIDCMPSLGMLTINALTAADSVIIPVQAQYLPAKGLEQLLRTITRVKRQLNPKLEVDGIVLTMVDSRTTLAREINALVRKSYGGHVFASEIPRSIKAGEISVENKCYRCENFEKVCAEQKKNNRSHNKKKSEPER